jgi:hypothetical protein
LSEPAPIAAERYEAYRSTDEKGKVGQLVGYGRGGKGDVGETPGIPNPWIKREGSNQVDDFIGGVGYLRMDFDSGKEEHNAIETGDLGLGLSEACLALYDSGGPFLINGKLAGWGRARDPVPGNSSWGQIMYYGRMSVFLDYYDQYVPPVVNSVILTRQTPPWAAYTVPAGSGNQLRTIAVGGTNQIVVAFSEDVVPSATVSVVGKESGTTYPITTSFPTARIVIININAPIQRNGVPGDKLTITISGIKKPGATGANLDGDWVNPDSVYNTTENNSKQALHAYPSGNGDPGGSLDFRFIVQPGDYNLDNIVNLDDFNAQKANFGKTSGATYAEGDADGDGDIDLSDFNACKNNFGVNWTSW